MRGFTAIGSATAAAITMLLASCGGSGSTSTRSTRTPVPGTAASHPAAPPARTSCVPTPLRRGPPPAWTALAWTGTASRGSSSGFAGSYALASGNAAAAFFFAGQLRAGHPTNPANKVLWVVRFARHGHPLTTTAHLASKRATVVRIGRPADSGPGEIYPSYIDLPTPGCWQLMLAWGTHRASIDIQIQRAASAPRSTA